MGRNRASIIITVIAALTIIYCIPVQASSLFGSGSYAGGVPVPEFRGVSVIDGAGLTINGKNNGIQLMNNIDFTDIRSHWAEPYILNMAAQSVIKGYGASLFKPEDPLTRQEAVALLVRIMGREAEVQRRAEGSVGGSAAGGIFDAWAREYISMAYELGIVTEGGGNWKDNATRQEVAVWFANALGLNPVYGAQQQYVFNLKDWQEIDASKLALIEAVLQEGIMKGNDRGYFNPAASLKRAEMATMLDKVADRFQDRRNVRSNRGQVLQIDTRQNQTVLGILNADGTSAAVVLAQGTGFPVYKDGRLAANSSLQAGDEIKYVYDDQGMVYAWAVNDGTIAAEVRSSGGDRLQVYYGQITGVFTNYGKNQQGASTENTHYRVVNVDGQIYDIVSEKNLESGLMRDIAVYRDGKLTGTSALKAGDEIEYGVLSGGQALYVEVLTLQNQVIEGYIQSVNSYDSKITLAGYDGRLYTYSYSASPKITINQRPGAVSDLRFGLEVAVTVSRGVITQIDGSYYIDQPGYIPAEGKTRSGRVTYVDSKSIVLDQDDGIQQEYSISPSTLITKEGSRINPGNIRIGDRVQVYMDDISSVYLSRIKVEGMQQLIKDVYRGTIERVYPSSGKLVLKDTYAYVNRGWEERDRRITFELDSDTPIYYGGKLLSLDQVQSSYINFEGYVAVSNNFNSEKAVKVVLKRGYEAQYGDRIDEISWATGELELRDSNNILFNDGTIIIFKNRLVDMTALEEDYTITVVADRYSGYNNAVLVILEDAVSTGEEIYVGRLNEIRTRQFDMNYYSLFEDNEWDSISGRTKNVTFYYDEDTLILDVSSQSVKKIKAADFFQGDYAGNSSYKSDDDYYAYVLVEDERAKAIRITKGSVIKDGSTISNADLETLRVTAGEVSGIDKDLQIITLNKASNWTNFYNEWERADDDVYVNYSKALIYRNGKPIEATQLRQGENVYVIRDDNRGIIILVL
ncbi:MAG: hypothetical protein HPY66_1859 [Firmicutes bacterium]|nr:hypothetical protein [Bacillota bacterium]